ncbi:MAG: ThuA domain-containing protein [Bacteroidota bacterium]
MKRIQRIQIALLIPFFTGTCFSQSLEKVKITEEWLSRITQIAPDAPRIQNVDKKRILVFSKATGFYHWTIPHNIEVLKILAKKTQAFEVQVGYDITNFERKALKKFDAVVLNNSNPSGPDRDLFADLMRQNSSLSDTEIAAMAPAYEKNLMDFVAKGGGLMVLHGAITVQNNNMEFSKLTGGSFDYHPPQQEMHLKEVDPRHPLVQAFKGKGLTHVDEPYFFKNAYFDYNFRPLLFIEADKLRDVKKKPERNTIYVSWIKRYGKGRVFYTSPSHNAQSLENPELLQFLLDGMRYVTGDLKCDDSPIGKP